MTLLNPLLRNTSPPPIPRAQEWAREYDGAHGAFIDLSQAVPGYPPHDEVLKRLAAAAGDPQTAGYGEITGDLALRQAYARDVSTLYEADVAPCEVAITAGCNQAFFAAMVAVARAGEAVILPSPWYFNHQMTLDMLGIEARPLPCSRENGFAPDPAAAARMIDSRVRAIALVSPNNPTGATYSPEALRDFLALCREQGVWLIVDETYRDFLAPGRGAPHGLFAESDWRDVFVQLYSFSKSFCIPGHRLGAVTAGRDFIEQFAKVLDCMQICAPRAGQAALAWAIGALDDWRAANRTEIAARAEAFRAAIGRLDGWQVDALGAYFAYVRHPFADAGAESVAKAMACERGVLCLPGSYFGTGQERHLRVAFANAGVDEIALLPERLAGFAPHSLHDS